jgi:hypothetical protein
VVAFRAQLQKSEPATADDFSFTPDDTVELSFDDLSKDAATSSSDRPKKMISCASLRR